MMKPVKLFRVVVEDSNTLIAESIHAAEIEVVSKYEGRLKVLQKENQSLQFEKEMLVEDKWAQRQLDLRVSDLQCQYMGWCILVTMLWLLGLWFI